jgi:hypothetical protein
MNCVFKLPSGKFCGKKVLAGSKYCCLHDKDSISLFFKIDSSPYKKDQFVFKLTKKDAELYIKNGFAVKIDNKLYKRFIDENE